MTRDINIYIFSSNYMTQEENKQFVDRLLSKGVNVQTFTDLSEFSRVLQECVEHYKDLHDPEVITDEEGNQKVIKKHYKFRFMENLIVLDDLDKAEL